MYLSKLQVNIQNPKVRRDLSDDYEMHRTIMRAFPDRNNDARKALGVLYHVKETDNEIIIYVQSIALPDWGQLPDKYVLFSAVKDISSLPHIFKAGTCLHYCLIANPTRKIKPVQCEGNGHHLSRRIFIVDDNEQINWLIKKGQQSGFCLIADEKGCPSVVLKPVRNGKGNKKDISFKRVMFMGKLIITNPERFETSWREGIGPEKAFGCGMLLLS